MGQSANIVHVIISQLSQQHFGIMYATLLEWKNIFFEPDTNVIRSRKTQVRIGAIQWQMREVESVEELLKQVEYFIDAV